MIYRAFRMFAWLLLLLFGLCRPALCGTTGKITGQVTDEAGHPLPGASVIFQGTRRGVEADAGGTFFLLAVEPGEYTLVASMIGYESQAQVGVRVLSGFTTNVFFKLKVLPMMLEPVVVQWARPPIEADRTTSQHTVALSEIERMLSSARSIQEMLQLQPGVSLDGANRIRGSAVEGGFEGNQVAYLVDGVQMNHNDARGMGGRLHTVNRGAVQELVVATGVLPAEYGNMQGGVVQVVTKDGGNRVEGWTEFRYEPSGKKHWGENVYDAPEHEGRVKWNDPKWLNEKRPALEGDDPRLKAMAEELIHVRTDYTKQIGWDAETALSGPVGERISYVATVKHARLANPLPGPERTGFYNDRGEFVPSGASNLSASGTMTFRAMEGLKVKIGAFHQGWRVWSDRPISFGGGISSFNLPGVIRGMGDGGRDLFLPEKWSAGGRQKFREELQYAVFTHALSPRTLYEVRLSRSLSLMDTVSGTHETTKENHQDEAGWFNIGRQAARWGRYDRQRYGFKLDLSSQVANAHLIKTGLEFLYGSLWMTSMLDSSPPDRNLLIVADRAQIGEPVHPLFFNAYVQDKMEFQGMIVDAGLRMDAFNPNSRQLTFGAYRGAPMFRTGRSAVPARFRSFSSGGWPGRPGQSRRLAPRPDPDRLGHARHGRF